MGSTGGATEGDCDIWITQKKSDVFSVVKVATFIKTDAQAEDLFKSYKRYYPDNRIKITLGSAIGFTTPEKSVLVFDCRSPKGRTAQNGDFGASVQVLLPDRRRGSDVPSERLAKSAARLAADTARYVSSDVLKCSTPRLPSGNPVQKPAAPTES
ncbi:hypothetical protein E4198_04325 [Streptomyces sp. RKND-216]|uniref:hypothetical protein n=1 Tax=Streptomyces sp. RKND-216 TaxID=2562581 RepID=UPI00109E1907|nr:hypothetical protein [Streptomyces sp. RKND-216]THA24062.1 hypothetical protein E4198_04325 [Streptomyces sp. RKND-216]